MIIDENVMVCITRSNYHNFKNLGYDNVNINNRIIVDVNHLTKGSHAIVKICCDICKEEKDIEFRIYKKLIANKGFYACSKCRFEKTKITNNERFGVDNVSFTDKVKNIIRDKSRINAYDPTIIGKRKKTNIEKFGVDNPFANRDIIDRMKEKTKQTKINMGLQISDEKLSDWQIYRKKVNCETRKNKNKLFENWNGLDYYDNEYIRNFSKLKWQDNKCPSIDHKISIYNGFKNQISPENIGKLDNLCITKRGINRNKHMSNESDFKYNS